MAMVLKGFVHDQYGNPVNNATVEVAVASDTGFGAVVDTVYSNANGLYTSSSLADGTYDVRVTNGTIKRFVKGNANLPMAISTAQIADLSVTTAKLGNDSVTGAKFGTIPCASVSVNADALSIASGTAITWNVEDKDNDTLWTSGAATRLTCTTAGTYFVQCTARVGATAVPILRLRKNGSTTIAERTGTVVSGVANMIVHGLVDLVATDYVEIVGLTSDASVWSIDYISGQDTTRATIHMVSG